MKYHYCIFYKNNTLQFGWIRDVKKSKLIVVPELGKEFGCSTSKVEFIWKGVEFENEKEALSYIRENKVRAEKESSKLEIDTIYELCEIGTPYTLAQLAENFLENPEDGWMVVALLLIIKKHRKLFNQKKDRFFARSEEEIVELEEKERKRIEAESRRILEQQWANLLLNQTLPEIKEETKPHWDHFLHRLRNFLLFFEKSQERDYFCSLFRCQLNRPEVAERQILNCLAKTEYPLSWGALVLERASVELRFKESEKRAAQQLSDRDAWVTPFSLETKDQRDLETFTVDNAETRDFDDALSFKKTDSETRVYIHIADVASYINKGEELFDVAESRISSIYTVKTTYPMFPPELSENLFSLVENRDRSVLTFEFCLSESGETRKPNIYRSVINVNENMDYESVDEKIATRKGFWVELWQFCETLKENRKRNGSLEIDRVEIKLDITDPENIKIKQIRENTPATMMIQELAILTNSTAAEYARDRQLSCLFRKQAPYSINKEMEPDQKPTLNDISIQPARISLESDQHSALGLSCYLQITSPIRRFLDLINQHVIFSDLANSTSDFTNEELLVWAKNGEEFQKEYNQVERKLLNHWKIKYLKQNQDTIYDAQFIRVLRRGRALINILDLQLYVEISIDESFRDDLLKIQIDDVLPEYNHVVARAVDI